MTKNFFSVFSILLPTLFCSLTASLLDSAVSSVTKNPNAGKLNKTTPVERKAQLIRWNTNLVCLRENLIDMS